MYKKKFEKRHVLTEVKLDDFGILNNLLICWLFRVEWQKVQLT
jgi:hypothetical protein